MAVFLRKYATATHIYVPMIKRGVVDFALGADWTPASGDVKVSIDGGAAANIGTLPTAVAMGNTAYWDFTIATGEVTGKKITVTVGDAATKAVEDQMFLIETYGHASAEYQADLSAANLPADAVKIGGTAQTGLDLGGNWTASRASKIDNLDAAMSTRSTYAGADTNGTTTLLARLTALRASNLDNLDASISGLNNLSALINIYGAPTLEIPDSSSTSFAFTVVVRDSDGKLVDLDASPTIAAANAAGTSRSANLSAVSHPATGRYAFTYAVSSTDAEESLRITVSGAVSSEARYIEWIGVVVNYDTLTTLNAIKAKTDNLPSSPAATSDCITAAGVRSALGFGAANADTQFNAIYNVAGLIQAKTDNLPNSPAAVGSAMTLTGAYDAAKTAASQASVNNLGSPMQAGSDVTLAAIQPNYAPALATTLATVKATLETVQKIVEADSVIDTNTTPWELVLYERGTNTELLRKQLKSSSGSNVVDTDTVICQEVQA